VTRYFITPQGVLLCLLLLLSACTLGPDYQRPSIATPTDFKELKGWTQAQPRDTSLPENWWVVFNDPYLSSLERQVALANQSIAEAEARYAQAQAMVQNAKAAYLPLLSTTLMSNRFRAASGQNVAVSGVRNLFGSMISVAWEPDLWGSVHHQVDANASTAQASAASLQAMRLSAQALLAQNYFLLRNIDTHSRLLTETITTYEKTLTIIQHRYRAGVVAKIDSVQAETQLASVRARLLESGIQRQQCEHAIAVLVGKAPSALNIPSRLMTTPVPSIPVLLPSQLLERRPDIAAAERLAAAANAQIGIAKAAYYPNLNLSASRGSQSIELSKLFTTAATYWALGPAALALPLFDGGARNAQLRSAIKNFEVTVAAYRNTVLTGFLEVEDALAELRLLAQAIEAQQHAVTSAQHAVELTMNQYQAGTVSYLNVMTAQATALTNEEAEVELQGRSLLAVVHLVKALGGGWDAKALPTPDKVGGTVTWQQFLPVPPSKP
jgi:NodT family efflux transporter outer membrane factor (OMF) lipoprotein